MDAKGKKVYIGLSGGVDSAVSAALLQRAGAEVTGVFIKGWYPPGMPCTWAADRRDAMRVAARLGIAFHTLDASHEYKRSVIDYLIAEYRAGRTPNPDVLCNQAVKFGTFYRFAKGDGADAIATGHYRSGEKDQSYFLWAVPKEILATALFPVGRMEKEGVRALARQYRLPVAKKKDSQGICFLGNISVEEFLKNEFGEMPGQAKDEEGRVVGRHNGVLLHTLGERVALHDGARPGPWFLLAKDIETNEMVVGRNRVPRGALVSSVHHIRFAGANWQGDPGGDVEAQCRYRGPKIAGRIVADAFVTTDPLSEIPTPGQSLVFYRDGELIGGATITI
jgi:tRNA-specific 2-thiouridylase